MHTHRKLTRLVGPMIVLLCLAGFLACSSDKGANLPPGDNGNDPVPETFTVTGPGDRVELALGTASGTFHFEARGFESVAQTEYYQAQRDFFWLYDGNYDLDTSVFLYKAIQYIRADYWCYGGKIKGYHNGDGDMFGETCFAVQWDKGRWYAFDVTWNGADISFAIDGVPQYTCSYGGNASALIAGIGWPPAGGENPGTIGMEYRNWGFTAR